jgi:hypothetical protein
VQWAEQYLRTGRIDELASNLIAAQGAMDRSTTVLNLSDIRPLKGLPTNAVRSTVTSLILVRCGLTELPPDIGGFKALERLIVAFNSVRTPSVLRIKQAMLTRTAADDLSSRDWSAKVAARTRRRS